MTPLHVLSNLRIVNRTCGVWLVLLCLYLPALVGCQRGEAATLPFETIERENWHWPPWSSQEPGLVIMATPEELTQLDGLVTEATQTQLREVDFQTHFVVAVFQGWYDSGQEGNTIEQVVRQGNTVTLHVHAGRKGGQLQETSPYHIIQVTKEGAWNQEIDFAVRFDDRRVVRRSHFIP
jgi:hypothetical protein